MEPGKISSGNAIYPALRFGERIKPDIVSGRENLEISDSFLASSTPAAKEKSISETSLPVKSEKLSDSEKAVPKDPEKTLLSEHHNIQPRNCLISQCAITPTSYQNSVPVALFIEDEAFNDESLMHENANDTANSGLMDSKPEEEPISILLKNVSSEKENYGLKMQPPCEECSLLRLKEQVRKEFDAELPDDYSRFLAGTNGMDHNGIVIYGSETSQIEGFDDRLIDGLIDANKTHRDIDSLKDFLVVGMSDDRLFVFDPKESDYKALDSASLASFESYSSFDEMLNKAIESYA